MSGPEPWEYAFEREMAAQLETIQAHLIGGRAEDYAQYRELCGQIRGIQICMAEVKRIQHRLSNPDGDVDLAGEGL
jgi:hypothetical protein